MDPARPDIIYYDGKLMPFDDATFDCILCIEVLEHSEDPQLLLSEIARVIKPQGTVLLSVPWSAREHYLPHDYYRFTRQRLQCLFAENSFGDVEIRERGNDICAIANKLTILTVRLIRPPPCLSHFVELPPRAAVGDARSLLHRCSTRFSRPGNGIKSRSTRVFCQS
jgi:SAM-dependent methyltransferase